MDTSSFKSSIVMGADCGSRPVFEELLRILVFLIQILILIPDSRAVFDFIFTLFILLTLSR